MKSKSRVTFCRTTMMKAINRGVWEGDKLNQAKAAVDTLQWVLDEDPIFAKEFPPSGGEQA